MEDRGEMMKLRKCGLLLGIFLAAIAPSAIANEAQLASPTAKTACKFADGKTITVNYSSPRMRGRKIFGDLVPFGEVWRAGADDATTFVPNVDVVVGGRRVPAGRYTLFTLPTPAKWTLIISKKIGEWGIPYPGEQYDFARMEMKVAKIPSPLENFTISFDPSGTNCNMKLDWETTRASINIAEKK
jgi:Protein of unknown function (DUF2911)